MTEATVMETVETPAIPEQPLEETVDSGTDWEALTDEGEESDEQMEEAAVEEAAPEAPVPAAPEPAPVAVPPVQPVIPVAEQPATPSVAPPPTVDHAAEQQRIQGELEKAYAFTEEEALAFQTEPELILPKLAANLHMRIAQDVLAGVQSVLPSLLQHVTTTSTAETAARELFYRTNQDLNNPAYEDAIIQCGKLFRSVNRDASPEQAAVLIGNMARQALGLAQLAAVNSTDAAAPITAAQPQPVPKITPFTPARGGSGQVGGVKPRSPWEELVSDDD